jgi:hypothetical protein
VALGFRVYEQSAYGQAFSGLGAPRDSCLDCVRKHLAQAACLMDEALQGYPQHRWLAVGHLAEASSECLDAHPALAQKLREHRLAYMRDPSYKVPVVDLIAKATDLCSPRMNGLAGFGEPPITPYPWQLDQPQPWAWTRAAPVIGVIAGALGIAVAVRTLMARRKRRHSR